MGACQQLSDRFKSSTTLAGEQCKLTRQSIVPFSQTYFLFLNLEHDKNVGSNGRLCKRNKKGCFSFIFFSSFFRLLLPGDHFSNYLPSIEPDEWEVEYSSVAFGKQIGEGAFGTVSKATVTGLLGFPPLKEVVVAVKKLKGERAENCFALVLTD